MHLAGGEHLADVKVPVDCGYPHVEKVWDVTQPPALVPDNLRAPPRAVRPLLELLLGDKAAAGVARFDNLRG